MTVWRSAFAAVYDRALRRAEQASLAAWRRELLAAAEGRVLEIGGGTGANLPYYGPRVSEVVVTEPDASMLLRLSARTARCEVPVRLLRAAAERLPFPPAIFDVAVSTLVLCSVPELAQALDELRRVLKPGGRLLFIEHVRAEDRTLARRQDRYRRVWSWVACGCHTNRATAESIARAGFTPAMLRRERMRHVPRIVGPVVIGAAVAADAGRAGSVERA